MKVSNMLRKIAKLKGSAHFQTFTDRFNELLEWEKKIKAENARILNLRLEPNCLKFDEISIPYTEDDLYPSGQYINDFMSQLRGYTEQVSRINERMGYLFLKIQDWANNNGTSISNVKIFSSHAEIDRSMVEQQEFVRNRTELRNKLHDDQGLFDKVVARFETELGATVHMIRTDPELRSEVETRRVELAQLTTQINEITTIAKFLEAFPSPTAEQMQIFTKRYSQS